MSVKKELMQMLSNPLIQEKDYSDMLIDIVYRENKEKTLALFLKIQVKDKERISEEKSVIMEGLNCSLNSFSHVARALLDNKSSKKAKGVLSVILEDDISYLIIICKAYFPKGNSNSSSNNGKWFFETFKNRLLKNQENYKKDGKDYFWAKNFKHLDYINLVLETEKK